MVKANAYGHGLKPIVEFSHNELKIKEFGTATLQEALYLREELGSFEFEILVFSDIQIYEKRAIEAYLHKRIIPVISSLQDFKYFITLPEFKHFPLVLKFNTGMNRLGIGMDEVSSVIRLMKVAGRKSIDHLMSHFSSSSLSLHKNKRNIFQKNEFDHLKSELQSSGISIEKTSLSNSGAIIQKGGLLESHIRPGLMLYGPSSLTPVMRKVYPWKGKVISKLETYIIGFYDISKGAPVGYGATPCPDNGIIAIIALGYGDGFSTRFQGSKISQKGHSGKIAGRVSMDMAQVFFHEDARADLKIGDTFTVWGHDQESFMGLSDQSGAIPYELFCQLSSRVPRSYHC